jgi:hypothetical protein
MLNNSKLLGGVMMLIVQCGAKYVVGDLGTFHEFILSHDYFKIIIVFAMFFTATRDIILSIGLTIGFVVFIDILLNEKRRYCLVPNKFKQGPILTVQQYTDMKNKIAKYETFIAQKK